MKRVWEEISDRLVLCGFFLFLSVLALVSPRQAIKMIGEYLED